MIKNCDTLDFLDENILDDMVCAKKIQSQHGFKAWRKYETSCKNHLDSWIIDVNKCLNGASLYKNQFTDEFDTSPNSVYSDKESSGVKLSGSFVFLVVIMLLLRFY